LIAYFVSAGDPKHKVFRSTKKLAIELIRAVYGQEGNPEKQMGVQSIIQNKINQREYEFVMNNQVAGADPANGVVKFLELSYKLNGKTYTKKVRENQILSFID
jgi:hypothetical protein